MYHYLGSHRLAEKTLRDAAKIDPHAPTTWYGVCSLLFCSNPIMFGSSLCLIVLALATPSSFAYSSYPLELPSLNYCIPTTHSQPTH